MIVYCAPVRLLDASLLSICDAHQSGDVRPVKSKHHHLLGDGGGAAVQLHAAPAAVRKWWGIIIIIFVAVPPKNLLMNSFCAEHCYPAPTAADDCAMAMAHQQCTSG